MNHQQGLIFTVVGSAMVAVFLNLCNSVLSAPQELPRDDETRTEMLKCDSKGCMCFLNIESIT